MALFLIRIQDMMKRLSALAVVAAMGFSTAACTQNEKRYAEWGGGGAAVGAVAGQLIGHSTEATLIGAAVGGAGGSLIAHEKNKKHNSRKCNYRDSRGRVYQAPCTQ